MNLKQILSLDELNSYKLHAARYNGEKQPLNVFVKDRTEWDSWNAWKGRNNEFNRPYVISFIQFYHERHTWLFGGIYKISGHQPHVQNDIGYTATPLPLGSDLIGRLKIKLDLKRGRSFNLENCYERIKVSEILKEPYNGEPFNGYENISLDWMELETIIKNQRTDWKTALENIKGIYLIADRHTGQKYVGSAYGNTGIWSRWSCYIETGHGWNKELINLSEKVNEQYYEENFRITLLECYSAKIDDNQVIARENFWKEALLTRGCFGYNSN